MSLKTFKKPEPDQDAFTFHVKKGQEEFRVRAMLKDLLELQSLPTFEERNDKRVARTRKTTLVTVQAELDRVEWGK